MRQVQGTQVLQEARVPAQALNAATHERLTQRGVDVTPASDVSHHSGVRRLQHSCDPKDAGSEQEYSGEVLRQGRVGESPKQE